MEFSTHYIRNICRNFESGADVGYCTNNTTTFTENKGGLYLKAELTEFDTDFYIPIMLFPRLRILIKSNTDNNNIINLKLIAKLIESNACIYYKTLNTITTTLLGQMYPKYELKKVGQTDTDNLYYGNNGLILDKNYKPLLLVTIICSVNSDLNIYIKGYKIFVDTSVLSDKTDPMKKQIISKILPIWCNPELLANNYYYRYRDCLDVNIAAKVTVNFCDFKKKFFFNTIAPDNSILTISNVDTLVNTTLMDNIEEIANTSTQEMNMYL